MTFGDLIFCDFVVIIWIINLKVCCVLLFFYIYVYIPLVFIFDLWVVVCLCSYTFGYFITLWSGINCTLVHSHETNLIIWPITNAASQRSEYMRSSDISAKSQLWRQIMKSFVACHTWCAERWRVRYALKSATVRDPSTDRRLFLTESPTADRKFTLKLAVENNSTVSWSSDETCNVAQMKYTGRMMCSSLLYYETLLTRSSATLNPTHSLTRLFADFK